MKKRFFTSIVVILIVVFSSHFYSIYLKKWRASIICRKRVRKGRGYRYIFQRFNIYVHHVFKNGAKKLALRKAKKSRRCYRSRRPPIVRSVTKVGNSRANVPVNLYHYVIMGKWKTRNSGMTLFLTKRSRRASLKEGNDRYIGKWVVKGKTLRIYKAKNLRSGGYRNFPFTIKSMTNTKLVVIPGAGGGGIVLYRPR